MRRLLAALLVGASLLWAAPASAADGIQIEHVQSTADGRTTLLVSAPGDTVIDPAGLSVSVDDVAVEDAEVSGADRVERTTVLLLDTSTSMRGAPLQAAVAAARTFLDAVPEDVRVGLVTFDVKVHERVAPTNDRAAVAAALGNLPLGPGTRLYDGVVAGVGSAGSTGSASLLVLSDGRDDSRTGNLQQAIAAAKKAGTVVDVVSLDRSADGRKALDRLVRGTGGDVVVAERSALERQFADRAAELAHQVTVAFPTPAGVSGSADIEVSLRTASGVVTDSAYAPLRAVPAQEAPAVRTVDAEGALGSAWLLGGGAVLGLGLVGLVLAAFGGGAKRRSASDQVAWFTDSDRAATATTTQSPERDLGSFKDSAIEAADKVMSEGLEERVANRLQGAGSRLAAAEWLLMHAAIVVIAGGLGLVSGGVGRGLVFLALGVAVPWLVLKVRHRRRLKAFNGQLAEMLQLAAGGLSAGLSMPQALNTVANEAAEPMAGELKRAIVEQRLGVDVTDALEAMADRMESQDARWVVMAMRIQREVGGNLAELLLTVSATLRERDDIRRKVAVLAAEGKVSAVVLGSLPIVMFLYMYLVRRDALRPMYTESLGRLLLGVGAVLLVGGAFWMSRMVKIEV